MRKIWAIVCAGLLGLGTMPLGADEITSPENAPPPQAATLTPDQLDTLVAPIALYPDVLLSQIMVASTYPLEIVQAYQWLQQHPDLKGQALTIAAQQQPWDPSLQALVAFPEVMKRLNQDITWTTNLGNAFLANQAAVMDAVQNMRSRADETGKLISTEQQKVVKTTDNGRPVIEIEPARPEVVYVPDYDPVWIWGPAPIYYGYPGWYYPTRPAFGWCWWSGGIYVNTVFVGWNGWGGWGWHPHWRDHVVIVNRNFITVNHFNTVRVDEVHGVNVWAHSSDHRMGVAYPNRVVSQHFRPAGFYSNPHVSVNQVRQQFHESAIRHADGDHFGSRRISPGAYDRNHTAFGGIEGRGAAGAHSSRGYSSLGYARGVNGGGAPVPAGGGHGSGSGRSPSGSGQGGGWQSNGGQGNGGQGDGGQGGRGGGWGGGGRR